MFQLALCSSTAPLQQCATSPAAAGCSLTQLNRTAPCQGPVLLTVTTPVSAQFPFYVTSAELAPDAVLQLGLYSAQPCTGPPDKIAVLPLNGSCYATSFSLGGQTLARLVSAAPLPTPTPSPSPSPSATPSAAATRTASASPTPLARPSGSPTPSAPLPVGTGSSGGGDSGASAASSGLPAPATAAVIVGVSCAVLLCLGAAAVYYLLRARRKRLLSSGALQPQAGATLAPAAAAEGTSSDAGGLGGAAADAATSHANPLAAVSAQQRPLPRQLDASGDWFVEIGGRRHWCDGEDGGILKFGWRRRVDASGTWYASAEGGMSDASPLLEVQV